MERTERGERDAQLVANRFKRGGGLQRTRDECAAFIVGPGIVRTNEVRQVALDLVSNQLEDIGQVLSFR